MNNTFNVDELTDVQIDKLQQRLTARANQLHAARLKAEHDRTDTSPLRPQIGDGGRAWGNELARRNWDKECIAAQERQTVPYAVAPGSSVLARDGKTRIAAGEELRPHDHLDVMLGDPMIQVAQLVERGFVLAKGGPL